MLDIKRLLPDRCCININSNDNDYNSDDIMYNNFNDNDNDYNDDSNEIENEFDEWKWEDVKSMFMKSGRSSISTGIIRMNNKENIIACGGYTRRGSSAIMCEYFDLGEDTIDKPSWKKLASLNESRVCASNILHWKRLNSILIGGGYKIKNDQDLTDESQLCDNVECLDLKKLNQWKFLGGWFSSKSNCKFITC